jgi:hypothetical protein
LPKKEISRAIWERARILNPNEYCSNSHDLPIKRQKKRRLQARRVRFHTQKSHYRLTDIFLSAEKS